MWGSSKTAVAVQVPAPAPALVLPPKPISIEALMAVEERAAYQDLCKEVGFRPAALIKDELLAFLQEIRQPVYQYQEVKEYLDKKLGKWDGAWGHTWGWCSMRSVDIEQSDLGERHHQKGNGQFAFGRTYHAAVPFEILDLVKKITVKVPDVHFFVSDTLRPIDRIGKDPFLAATTVGMGEMIVIAEWDEPSFRAEKVNEQK